MMWRVLAAMDFVTTPELHWGVSAPAVGVSLGFHFAIGAWSWKFDRRCLLGPIPTNSPPVLGHDAGILRPHILVDPSPIPPPPACSAISSALATACSALKPTFSSSRDLRNGGGALPVSTEMVPYVGIFLSGNVPCGFAGPHYGIPLIPTQLTDWSGLTVGDIVGGMAYMMTEWAFQAAIEATAIFGGRFNKLAIGGSVLFKTIIGEMINNTVAFTFAYGIPGFNAIFGTEAGVDPSRVATPVQQAVDSLLSDNGMNPNAPSDFNPMDAMPSPSGVPFAPFGPAVP